MECCQENANARMPVDYDSIGIRTPSLTVTFSLSVCIARKYVSLEICVARKYASLGNMRR